MNGDSAFGLATQIGRELKAKVDAAIAAALGARLGLGCPATEEDVRSLRHRLASVETGEQRWYYLDREPIFGHTLPKATWHEATWSEDGSTLRRRMTLESRSLPLEQAPTMPEIRAAALPVTCEFPQGSQLVPRVQDLGIHTDWRIPCDGDRYDLGVPAHQVSEDEDPDEQGL